MGWQLHLARLEEERKAWVLDLFLKEKGSSLLMDNFKSIKDRKRTQSWLGFNRRQPHVLGTCYYSGISPPIISETLQGLPYSVEQIQSDTGLSTRLLNSVLLGSISSSQVYQFRVPCMFLTAPVWIFMETCLTQGTEVAVSHKSTDPVDHLLNRDWPRNATLHL